ncbi:hypothetical protein ACWV95_06225 [Streptomyces albus]
MTDTVSGTSGAPGASDPSDAPGAVRPPADPGAGGFTEALAEATAVASLAPSSHNCQPWALARLTGERARAAARLFAGTGNRTGPAGDGTETLALAMDRTRTIGALAAHDVEMRVSCGAYWQLLLSALAAQGWHPEGIEYPATDGEGRRLAGDRWPESWSLLGVARVRRTGDGDGSFRRLRETAAARRTNRGPYRASGIGTDVLAELTGPSAGAAADAPVAVTHLRGETERRAFGDFVARHGGRDFSHDAAWREKPSPTCGPTPPQPRSAVTASPLSSCSDRCPRPGTTSFGPPWPRAPCACCASPATPGCWRPSWPRSSGGLRPSPSCTSSPTNRPAPTWCVRAPGWPTTGCGPHTPGWPCTR